MTLGKLENEHHQKCQGVEKHHDVYDAQDFFVVFRNPTDLPADPKFDGECAVTVEEREDIPPLSAA